MSDGFARCLNHAEGCEMAGVDRPVKFELERTSEMATDLPIEVTANYHPIFDSDDLVCPECGSACASLTEPARKIPKQFA